MNTDFILSNLREARDELAKTILEIERDPEFDSGELFIALQHAYHHINTSWNARFSTDAEVAGVSESDFARWRQFPRDLEPGG